MYSSSGQTFGQIIIFNVFERSLQGSIYLIKNTVKNGILLIYITIQNSCFI